jgi:membrane protein required for colicin V production
MLSLPNGVHLGLSGMNLLDWAIALILAISTVTAFMRGLIRSLVSLIGLAGGIALACWFAPQGAAYLVRWIKPLALAEIAAFILIVAGTYAVATLLGRLIRGAASAVGLGFFDRLAGAAFGFVRGVLLLAASLLPFAALLPQFGPARGSILLPYLLPAAHGISFVMPRNFGLRLTQNSWWNHASAAMSEFAPVEGRKKPSDLR